MRFRDHILLPELGGGGGGAGDAGLLLVTLGVLVGPTEGELGMEMERGVANSSPVFGAGRGEDVSTLLAAESSTAQGSGASPGLVAALPPLPAVAGCWGRWKPSLFSGCCSAVEVEP